MTAKEYLEQARSLDRRIDQKLKELDSLKKMVPGPTAPNLKPHYNATRNTEAPFVSWVEKVVMREQAINDAIDQLVDLKIQIQQAIDTVPDADERLVLQYRYVDNLDWQEVSKRLGVGAATVYRWHDSALKDMTMPKNPLKI